MNLQAGIEFPLVQSTPDKDDLTRGPRQPSTAISHLQSSRRGFRVSGFRGLLVKGIRGLWIKGLRGLGASSARGPLSVTLWFPLALFGFWVPAKNKQVMKCTLISLVQNVIAGLPRVSLLFLFLFVCVCVLWRFNEGAQVKRYISGDLYAETSSHLFRVCEFRVWVGAKAAKWKRLG